VSDARYAIAVGRFYEDLAERLVAGAQEAFAAAGASADVFDVPGAFELPLAASYLAGTGRYDGVACLGAVVRGETDHYDFICDAVCHGVMAIGAETGAAIGFGLLTVDTLQQAIARSANDRMNKGGEAAHALLGQVALRRRWGLA
jgi:6,7-dimethyl-8-ribityllumazine synthase